MPEVAPVAQPVAMPIPASTIAATPLDAAPPKPAEDSGGKVEDQLRNLKRLFDQGLISADVYADKQRKILDALK
jgi:hypothetical protein